MRRLIGGLALLVLAGTAAACGQTVATGPAVAVSWTHGSDLPGDLYTARLSPSVNPSGFIAFRAVHDGTVKTIARCAFHALASPGSVRVKTAGRSILVAWTVPGGTGPHVARFTIPKGQQNGGVSWSGGTVEPSSGSRTWTVWEEEYARSWPNAGYAGMTIGNFGALVFDSAHNPRRSAYCITIEVDPR